MKYLVMECHVSHAVVLSDEGQFLKVANMRYEVGQTVDHVIEMQTPEVHTKSRSTIRWLTPVLSAAACLVLMVTLFFFRAPYASVYLTINPEVRIDVNRSDMVVGVTGVNDDGAMLLEGYDHHRKDLDTVMDELVDRAIAMGYLSDGGTVTLTLDADDEWVVSHSDSLSTHLSEHLTGDISVIVEITAPAPETGAPTQPGYHDTDYGQTDYGTDYGEPTDPDTDYDPTEEPDDGMTDYDDPEDGDDVTDDDADSGYDEDDDGDSDYDDVTEPTT